MSMTAGTFARRAGASVLGIGYIPFASGTFGSAAAIGAIWLLHTYVPALFEPESVVVYWVVLAGMTALSFRLCNRAKEDFGREDPPQVVFDEFVGQFITFLMVPITVRTLILGFLLFRFFDIIKPYPVHHFEELEGGVGITMDDVMAGVYANLCLLTTLAIYHALRGALV